jgi:hypothetical protein
VSSNLKRKLAFGVASLAAVAFAGGAYAANQDSGANARQAFLNDVAKRLNVSPKQLSSAVSGAALDQLNAAVKAGKLSQAQADAIKQRMQQRGGLPPAGPFPFGPRRFLHPSMGGPIGGPLGGPFGGAASYLGISAAQLFKMLGSGKTLAQIAQSRGKSVSGLRQAMVAAVKARLDKAVAAKMITSAQEQKILGNVPSMIDRKLSRPGYGPRFREFRGKGGPDRRFPGLAAPPAFAIPAGPPPGTP